MSLLCPQAIWAVCNCDIKTLPAQLLLFHLSISQSLSGQKNKCFTNLIRVKNQRDFTSWESCFVFVIKKKECCDLQVSYLGLGSLSAHHLLRFLIFHKGVFPLASAKSCFFNILLKSLHQAFSRFKDI